MGVGNKGVFCSFLIFLCSYVRCGLYFDIHIHCHLVFASGALPWYSYNYLLFLVHINK